MHLGAKERPVALLFVSMVAPLSSCSDDAMQESMLCNIRTSRAQVAYETL